MHKHLTIGSLLLATTLTACGDDDGGGKSAGFEQFEGIYETTSHTRNENGCDAPGPSVLASPAPMYASVAIEFFGYASISLTECEDLASCRADADEVAMNNFPPLFGGYSFGSVNGKSASGTAAYTGSSGSGPCAGGQQTHTMTIEEDGSVTIEIRTTEVDNVPRDAEGDCDLDAVEGLAAGQPCSTLETIHADLVEAR